MRRGLIVATLWTAAAGAVLAQDGAVTIVPHKPKAGDVIEVTETDDKVTKTTVTVKGRSDARFEKEKSRVAYTQELLAVAADGTPRKVRREYKTFELSKDAKKEDYKLEGKTILAEKTGEAFAVTFADGKVPEGKAADYLAAKFRHFGKDMSEQDVFPTTPIKPGETWKIDATRVVKSMADSGLTLDADLSSGTGRLIKVYDKNGHKFGVVALTLDLVVTKAGTGDKALSLKTGSRMRIETTGDGCIDGGEATGTMKMKVTADLVGDVPNADLLVQITSTGTKSTAEVKKK